MNSQELYEGVIAGALLDGPPRRRTPVSLELSNPTMVRIADAGFYPNRWVAYCDDYLGGGLLYDRWISGSCEKPHNFENLAHHTRGPCVTSMSLEGGVAVLRSRACLWVPTGILDLKLLAMTCARLGVPGRWEIEDLMLDPATVFSYHRFAELGGDSAFAKRARQILRDTPDAALSKHRPGILGRHKKAIRRGRLGLVTDESRIDAFTLVIPRDFVWASDGEMRESWIMKTVGRRGHGEYQWDSLDYPELGKVVERLPTYTSIGEMAFRRSQRG